MGGFYYTSDNILYWFRDESNSTGKTQTKRARCVQCVQCVQRIHLLTDSVSDKKCPLLWAMLYGYYAASDINSVSF